MKRLIAITTLGLVLGFSSISFAFDNYNVFGVQVPIVKSDVKNEIRGSRVESDFTSFYTTPKTANTITSITADKESDNDYISVFGVWVPVSPRG
jgi:hypothetical protein